MLMYCALPPPLSLYLCFPRSVSTSVSLSFSLPSPFPSSLVCNLSVGVLH